MLATKEEAEQIKVEIKALSERVKTSKAYHEKTREQFDAPLRTWHAEVSEALAALVGKIEDSKAAVKAKQDDAKAQAKRADEAEKSLVTTKDEYEHQVEIYEASKREKDEEEANFQSKLEALKAERDAVDARRIDALDRAKRAARALDEANSRLAGSDERQRGLQTELQEAKAAVQQIEVQRAAERAEAASRLAAVEENSDRLRKQARAPIRGHARRCQGRKRRGDCSHERQHRQAQHPARFDQGAPRSRPRTARHPPAGQHAA